MFENREYYKKDRDIVVRKKKIIPVSGSSSSLMNRLAGDHVVIEYRLKAPKQITKHDPNKYSDVSMSLEVLRKKHYRKASWRKHRRRWRRELRNENWEKLSKLHTKPHDIAWEVW